MQREARRAKRAYQRVVDSGRQHVALPVAELAFGPGQHGPQPAARNALARLRERVQGEPALRDLREEEA